MLKISVLGSLTLSLDEKPLTALARKAEALLVYLACTGETHERESLAGLLWSEHSQERAMTSLRVLLTSLRRGVAPHLTVTRQTIAFNFASAHWLDVAELEQELTKAEAKWQAGDLTEANLTTLAHTLTLYQDDFLTGFHIRNNEGFTAWLMTERERLLIRVIAALHSLVDAYTELGQYQSGIIQANRLLHLDPLREEAHRQMMRLLTFQGQRTAALAQFETCQQVLAEAMDIAPMPETVALYEQIHSGELQPIPGPARITTSSPSPPSPRPSQPPLHVPTPSTPFIGRNEELQQIADLLQDPVCRFLTIIGPGGIGKTRLASQAARQAMTYVSHNPATSNKAFLFSHGIYFIGLTALSSADLLVPTIAHALNFSFYRGTDTADQLLNYLREKHLLLVLDNFEHLMGGLDFLTTILHHAPHVKLLVVSRERLNLQGEYLLPIQGLTFPTVDDNLPRQNGNGFEGYSAINLFVQQATAIQPDFSLNDADKSCVTHICRIVEGIPLAVELAAAWTRMLSCPEIVQEIEQNLDFLTTSLRNVPERHQSLRAVFDYSWQLLSAREKAIFMKLAVFRGGFQREAAQEIAGASLLDLLALVDKSLLRRTTEGRFESHLLLLQYGIEKLAENPVEKALVEAKHSAYYLGYLQAREASLQGGRQQAALVELRAELENMRIAWRWVLENENIETIDNVVGSLFQFYDMHSWFQEGAEVFGQAAARLAAVSGTSLTDTPDPQIVLGKILARQGWCLFQLGQHEQAERLLHRSLTMLRALGPEARPALVFTLNYLGAMYGRIGDADYARAWQYLQESLRICQEVDDRFGLSIVLNILGWVAYLQGDYPQAKYFCQESLVVNEEIDNHWGIAFSLEYLGQVYVTLTDYDEAKRLFQDSLEIRQQMGDKRGIALSFKHLGDVALAQGYSAEADRLYRESLATLKEIGHYWGIISAHTNLGLAACAKNDYPAAQVSFTEALQMVMDLQAMHLALNVLVGVATLYTKTQADERALELITLILNDPTSNRDDQDRVAHLLLDLAPRVSPEMVKTAKIRSQTRDIEMIVAEMLTGTPRRK